MVLGYQLFTEEYKNLTQYFVLRLSPVKSYVVPRYKINACLLRMSEVTGSYLRLLRLTSHGYS
jgi:hypothetical protein